MAMNGILHYVSDTIQPTSQPFAPRKETSALAAARTSPCIPTTIMPTPANTTSANAEFTIEELDDEDDLGYASDIEVLHPYELEEAPGSDGSSDTEEAHKGTTQPSPIEEQQDEEGESSSDTALTRQIRRLRCQENGSPEKHTGLRQHIHLQQKIQRQPPASTTRKRAHSETISPTSEPEYLGRGTTYTSASEAPTSRGPSSANKSRRIRGPRAEAPTAPSLSNLGGNDLTAMDMDVDTGMDIDSYDTGTGTSIG